MDVQTQNWNDIQISGVDLNVSEKKQTFPSETTIKLKQGIIEGLLGHWCLGTATRIVRRALLNSMV